MKKLLSLLVIALTAMSAWGFTVTFTPATVVGHNSTATMPDTIALDGVKITCTLGGFNVSRNVYRFAAFSTTKISSTVGKITKVVFTTTGGSYGGDGFSGDGYNGNGTWEGKADTLSLYASHQVRATKIVVTIEDPISELTAPTFYPNGAVFTDTLEVSLGCPTLDGVIHYIEGSSEDNFDWSTHTIYDGPFVVTCSKTYTAWTTLGEEQSEYVTATFTRTVPTIPTPVFTPATCNFEDSLEVSLECEDSLATIYYSYDNMEWLEYTGTLVIYDNTAIFAKASFLDHEYGLIESDVVSAAYTKVDASGTRVVIIPYYTGHIDEAGKPYTVSRDGVTFTVTRGNIDGSFRIFKNQNIIFSAMQGNIIKIELVSMYDQYYNYNYGPDRFELNDGQNGSYSYPEEGGTGTWLGESPIVVFNTNKGQGRCSMFRVYVDSEIPAITVASPVFDLESDTTRFVYSKDVVLTCPTQGATMYYTTDFNTWYEYNDHITITDSCNVYAYAQVDGVRSPIVFSTFFKGPEVNNIAEANQLPHHALFGFNGEVIVTYQNGANTWIKDDSGYGLIYDENLPRFPQGTVLKPGWDGNKTDFNTVPEYTDVHNVEATGEVVEVTPTEVTSVSDDNFNQYVFLRNQTLVSQGQYDKKEWTSDSRVIFYNRFTDLELNLELGKTYDIVGIVGHYRKATEVYIISATEVIDWQLGDVNHSQTVDIDDVTMLIARVLGNTPEGFYEEQANCDGQGGIDIDDVTMLIDRVLTGSW